VARFGAISPVVLACPRSDRSDVNATLLDLGAQEDTIVFETTAQDVLASKALRLQVRESWNIEELATHYSEFIQLFRPLWQALREQENLQPSDCFLARILLIHEYRKLLLRDPQLPDELLPGDWEGRAAAVVPQHLPFDLCQGRGMAEQCTGNRRRPIAGCG
jgi:phenylacetic acid degradation operon negative regulatory protein